LAPFRELRARPPKDLVANFHLLFNEKVEATRELARQAARIHDLLPEFF
jgi:hypothetical protein